MFIETHFCLSSLGVLAIPLRYNILIEKRLNISSPRVAISYIKKIFIELNFNIPWSGVVWEYTIP